MRDLVSTDLAGAAHYAAYDFPPDRPDPSEYMDEPCDAIDGDDLPYTEDDAPPWARSESEQDWRAEMMADAGL